MVEYVITLSLIILFAIVALVYVCSYLRWKSRLIESSKEYSDTRKRWIEYPDGTVRELK